MTDTNKNDDLAKKLKDIEQQLSIISPAFTEIAGDRVYQHAIAKLIKSSKDILASIAIIVAVIGISSYQEIVKQGSEKVATAFAEQVIPEIREGLKPQIESQLKSVQSLIDQRAKQYSDRLDTQLASILQANEAKLDAQLTEMYAYIDSVKNSNNAVPNVIKKPIKAPVIGYTFFGDINDEKNTIENASFTLDNKEKGSIPENGDNAVSVKSVVIRSRPPEYQTIIRKVPYTTTTYDKIRVLGASISIPKPVVKYRDEKVSILESPAESSVLGSLSTQTKVQITEVKKFDKAIWVKVSEIQ